MHLQGGGEENLDEYQSVNSNLVNSDFQVIFAQFNRYLMPFIENSFRCLPFLSYSQPVSVWKILTAIVNARKSQKGTHSMMDLTTYR